MAAWTSIPVMLLLDFLLYSLHSKITILDNVLVSAADKYGKSALVIRTTLVIYDYVVLILKFSIYFVIQIARKKRAATFQAVEQIFHWDLPRHSLLVAFSRSTVNVPLLCFVKDLLSIGQRKETAPGFSSCHFALHTWRAQFATEALASVATSELTSAAFISRRDVARFMTQVGALFLILAVTFVWTGSKAGSTICHALFLTGMAM